MTLDLSYSRRITTTATNRPPILLHAVVGVPVAVVVVVAVAAVALPMVGVAAMEDPSSSKEAPAPPSPFARSAANPIMKSCNAGTAMMSPTKDNRSPRPRVWLLPDME